MNTHPRETKYGIYFPRYFTEAQRLTVWLSLFNRWDEL